MGQTHTVSESFPHQVKDFTRSEKAFIHALCALLEEKPFGQVSVIEILKRAGFTKGAFYGRFTSKEDFVEKITDHLFDMIVYKGLVVLEYAVDKPFALLLAQQTQSFEFLYEYRDYFGAALDGKLPDISD